MVEVVGIRIEVEEDAAVRAFRNFGRVADNELERVERGAKEADRAVERVGKEGGLSLGKLAAAATAAWAAFEGAQEVVGFLSDGVDAASDYAESLSKLEVIAGEVAANDIAGWAEGAATTIGATSAQALEMTGTMANLLKTVGTAPDQIGTMSTGIVELGADLASFHNVAGGTPEVLDKIRAGLVGEAEPLRTLGVLLSAARVEEEAYASGIAERGEKLTEAQKVQARYNIILQDTVDAQGDFARTSDGLANSQRILQASIGDVQREIGEALIPAVQSAVSWIGKLFTTEAEENAREMNKRIADFADEFERVAGTDLENQQIQFAAISESLEEAGGEVGNITVIVDKLKELDGIGFDPLVALAKPAFLQGIAEVESVIDSLDESRDLWRVGLDDGFDWTFGIVPAAHDLAGTFGWVDSANDRVETLRASASSLVDVFHSVGIEAGILNQSYDEQRITVDELAVVIQEYARANWDKEISDRAAKIIAEEMIRVEVQRSQLLSQRSAQLQIVEARIRATETAEDDLLTAHQAARVGWDNLTEAEQEALKPLKDYIQLLEELFGMPTEKRLAIRVEVLGMADAIDMLQLFTEPGAAQAELERLRNRAIKWDTGGTGGSGGGGGGGTGGRSGPSAQEIALRDRFITEGIEQQEAQRLAQQSIRFATGQTAWGVQVDPFQWGRQQWQAGQQTEIEVALADRSKDDLAETVRDRLEFLKIHDQQGYDAAVAFYGDETNLGNLTVEELGHLLEYVDPLVTTQEEALELAKEEAARLRESDIHARASWNQMVSDLREMNEREAERDRKEAQATILGVRAAFGDDDAAFERWLNSPEGQRVAAGLNTQPAPVPDRVPAHPGFIIDPVSGRAVPFGDATGQAAAAANPNAVTPWQAHLLNGINRIADNTESDGSQLAVR